MKSRALLAALVTVVTLLCVPSARGAHLRSMQSGVATIANGSASTTVTIVPVTPARAFLVFSVTLNDSSPTNGNISGQLTNATTLTFARTGTVTAATVKWYVAEFGDGATVQRGSVTMNATTKNVTLSSVTTSRSFPLVSLRNTGATYGSDDFVRAKLTSSTNLQLGMNAASGSAVAEWQVVEYTGASVQTGDVTFASGDSAKTATIGSVNTGAAWLVYSYQSQSGTGANIGQKLVRGVVTNATTLTFDRNNTGQGLTLTWVVVEFTDGTTVQKGSQSFTSSDTQKDVGIGTVAPGATLAVGGAHLRGGRSPYSAAGNPGVGWCTFDLTSATNLRITRALTGAVATDAGWFVVTFPRRHIIRSGAPSPPTAPGQRTLALPSGLIPEHIPERRVQTMAASEADVLAFVNKAFGDLGGALTAAMVVIGDKLGLYKALAADGPLTSAELAGRTGTAERYVREWLAAQAAAGYLTYDPANGRYTLPEAHAAALADEDSPACILGGFQGMTAAMKAEPKITEAFRTGKGVGWHEHDPGLFQGTERFFRPGYNAHLVGEWIPALDGVQAKLEAGARVADVGCGHGASTIIMAKAFPRSTFTGFDYHPASIESAHQKAREAGVGDRVRFEVAAAKSYPGTGYDLVACFDCLHDMGDPIGAARHVRQSLAPDGTWLLVEPFAHDRVEDNLNPIGRVFYSVSTLVCTPASLSQEVGLALGAQAGEARLGDVLRQAGFTRIRRATETPFNLVLEARP